MKSRPIFVQAGKEPYHFSYDGGQLQSIDDGHKKILTATGVGVGGQPTQVEVNGVAKIQLDYYAPSDLSCGGEVPPLCRLIIQGDRTGPLFAESYKYDELGRLATIGSTQQTTSIVRDYAGRVVKVENEATGNTPSATTEPLRPSEEFRFDGRGRLTSSSQTGSIEYDDAANYAFDGPRKIGNEEISYRRDGRVIAIGKTHDVVVVYKVDRLTLVALLTLLDILGFIPAHSTSHSRPHIADADLVINSDFVKSRWVSSQTTSSIFTDLRQPRH